MEEHMQRKLLGVCQWTSVILGTETGIVFTPVTVQAKYLFAVPPADSSVQLCACTLMKRPCTAPCCSISAQLPREPSLEPQSTIPKVYFQVICTSLPVTAKLIG